MKIPVSYQDCNCHVCGSSESVSLFDIRDELLVNEADDELRFDLYYHHCPECGLVFCNPQLSDNCWQQFYRGCRNGANLSETLDQVVQRYHQTPFALLQDQFRSNETFLDLGCGAGDLLHYVREIGGLKVQGVELSDILVPVAEQRGIDVLQADLMEIEFPAESQDWISLSHVLEHLQEPEKILTRIRRWLADGGRLLIVVPSVFQPLKGERNIYCSHAVMFSPDNLMALLKKCGYRTKVQEHGSNLLAVAEVAEPLWELPSKEMAAAPAEFVRDFLIEQRQELARIQGVLENQLNRWRSDGQPVLIWGAGEHTHKLMDRFSFEGVVLQGVIDSNRKAWGNRFRDLEIVSPDRLSGFTGDVLVSSHAYQEEIADQIRQRNPDVGVVTLYRKEEA